MMKPILIVFLTLASLPFFCHVILSQNIQTISIDVDQKHQTIEGFGTCVIDFLDDPEMPDHFDDSLYDMAVYDLGLSMIRFSFPQSMEWKNDNNDPDIFNWNGFNMEQLNKRMKVAQEFQKRGVKKVLVSTWSPPEFTKTHQSTLFGGHLRMDMYEEYAENFSAMVIAAKQNWGVNVGAIGLQNELLFIEPYKSCIYNPYQAREAVRVLQRKFQREGIVTKIIMPEEMMSLHRMKAYVSPTIEDKETSRFNGAFASHRLDEGENLERWANFIASTGKQSWMTETSGHATTWQGALELAEDMYQYLVLGNYSAWLYWQISGGKENVYALMAQHRPLPKYHASKHYYKYIRPGAKRVQANTDGQVMVSAFVHPVSGQLTLVLVNNSENDGIIKINSPAYHQNKAKGYLSTEDNYFRPFDIKNEIQLPAKSIATIVSQNSELITDDEIEEWPEAWKGKIGEDIFLGKQEKPSSGEGDYIGLLARVGNMELLKEQLKTTDINSPSYNGWTPLMWACLSGEVEVIDYLIKQGANINATSMDNWSVLHAAASTYKNSSENKAMTKVDVLKKVLNANPDINVRTTEGYTALHATVMNAHTAYSQQENEVLERIELLIDAGISIDVRDNDKRTALHWAAWQGYENMVNVSSMVIEKLIGLGADFNARDKWGNTPLHYAVKMGYTPIIKSLISYGTDPQIKNYLGVSPIDIAQRRSDDELQNQLIDPELFNEYKKKKNDQGSGYLGAELLEAAWKGNKKLVIKLLKKGADPSYRDSDGFTATQRARDGGYNEIVEILTNYKTTE